MKRKRNRKIAYAGLALMLLSLLLPAWAGALAQGEESIAVPIFSETPVFAADGAQIGELLADESQKVSLVLKSKETYPGVLVTYSPVIEQSTAQGESPVGKTLVQFSIALEGDQAQPAGMPAEGWIDANLVVSALTQQHAQDADTIASQAAQIDEFSSGEQITTPEPTSTPEPIVVKEPSFFSPEKMAIWVPIAAVALGICGILLLGWIAFSASTTAWETRCQAERLAKLNEKIADGLSLKSPVLVEQTAWPNRAMVEVNSGAIDYMAKTLGIVARQGQTTAQEPIPAPPPPPVPEGEEPDLLALANRLAGVVSIPDWQAIVKAAGWHAVLLRANPNHNGTYIADESGYSVIACLMRDEEADIGYVLPSHQDTNASEPRWSEFFNITEEMSVRNYRVDALPVMFIERGAFYLQKTVGRLIRRKQYT